MQYSIEELKKHIKEYQKRYPKGFEKDNPMIQTLFKWEWKLLTQLGIVSRDGNLIANYPMLEIREGQESELKDFYGIKATIEHKIAEINSAGLKKKANMTFVARNYTNYQKALNELNEEERRRNYAIEVNRPPIENY